MGKKVILVRMKLYGNDNIMLQRRVRILFFFPAWRDWKLINNELHQHDAKIVSAVDNIVKLVDNRKEIEKRIKAEVKAFNGGHETQPFYMTVTGKDRFYKREPDLSPVPGDWRAYLSTKLTGDKPSDIRGKMGVPEHKSSNRTAYSLKELENFNIAIQMDDSIGADTVMSFREPSNNSKSDQSRKKRKDETPEEHQARLRRMDNGDYS